MTIEKLSRIIKNALAMFSVQYTQERTHMYASIHT